MDEVLEGGGVNVVVRRGDTVAYAVYRFAPLGHGGRVAEQAARATLFCDAYGELDRTALIATVIDRLRELVAFMHARAAAGDAAFAHHIARGDTRVYERDIAHLEAIGYPSVR